MDNDISGLRAKSDPLDPYALFCEKCGSHFSQGAVYCATCGASIASSDSPKTSLFQRIKDIGTVVLVAPFFILFGLVVLYLNTGAFLFFTPADIWRAMPFSEQSQARSNCEDVSPWLLRSDQRMQNISRELDAFDVDTFVPSDAVTARAVLKAALDEERVDPAPLEAQRLQQHRIETLEAMIEFFTAVLQLDQRTAEIWINEADISNREEQQEYQRLRDMCR